MIRPATSVYTSWGVLILRWEAILRSKPLELQMKSVMGQEGKTTHRLEIHTEGSDAD